MGRLRDPFVTATRLAAASFLLVLLWHTLQVYGLYGGDWTSVFTTGANMRVPESLRGRTHQRAGNGYDAQFYRFMAHDPLLRGDTLLSMDDPSIRARRMLVPATAYLLGAGQPRAIDAAYVVVVALGTAAGVYWLAMFAALHGVSPLAGLLFLAIPATIVSAQRLTVDVVLAALCAGFMYYSRRDALLAVAAITAAAGLVRETGVALAAGACLAALLARQWSRSMLFAATAVPMLLWGAYARARVAAVVPENPYQAVTTQLEFFEHAGAGLLLRLRDPVNYPYPPWKNFVAQAFDVAAMGGIAIGVILAVSWLRERPVRGEQWTTAAFAALAIGAPAGFWEDVNGWGRVFGPLYLFLIARKLQGGSWWNLAPVALGCARMLLQLQGSVMDLVRAVL